MIIFPSLPNDFSPCISYSKHYKSLRTINGAHIKKPPMVIRGQIKNGNGTNKYLRLSNLFEYHIYDLPLQRKPFFLYSLVVVFFPTVSPVRQSTPKKCFPPHLKQVGSPKRTREGRLKVKCLQNGRESHLVFESELSRN